MVWIIMHCDCMKPGNYGYQQVLSFLLRCFAITILWTKKLELACVLSFCQSSLSEQIGQSILLYTAHTVVTDALAKIVNCVKMKNQMFVIVNIMALCLSLIIGVHWNACFSIRLPTFIHFTSLDDWSTINIKKQPRLKQT